MSAQSLSGSCLSFFKEQLPPQQFNSWIKPLIFEIDGDKLILTAPNSFTLRIVQDRYQAGLTTITEVLTAQTARLRAQFNELAARYDLYLGYAEVSLASGTLKDVAAFGP